VRLMYPAPIPKSSARQSIRHKNFTDRTEAVENYCSSSDKAGFLTRCAKKSDFWEILGDAIEPLPQVCDVAQTGRPMAAVRAD